MKKLIFTAIISILATSAALADCQEPSAPTCVKGDETYNKKDAYEACRADVTQYHKDSTDYITCLQTEAQKAADEAQSKINDIGEKTNKLIKDFNCKSGITDDC